MRVVKQLLTSFRSTNLTAEYSDWVSTTTYAAGGWVIYENYIYKSVVDANLNIVPSENTGKWLLMEVSNIYASIDLQSNTASVCDATTIVSGTDYDLTLEFNVGDSDMVIFGEAIGSVITIKEYNSSDVLLNTVVKTIDETQRVPAINYAHTITATTSYIELVVTELTTGGYSSIGYMVAGEGEYLGASLYGAKPGMIDYSSKETDYNGQTVITRRAIRDTLEIDVVYDASSTMKIKRTIKSLRGEVHGFIGDETTDGDYENLVILGYFEDFTPVLSNAAKTFASISIEEVI